MPIETDIRQAKFKSVYQKVTINLLYTHSWLSNRHQDVFKPYGLTMQQFNVLRILRGQYPLATTVNAIIERMIDKTSNVSRLLDKLVAKNLVQRNSCPNDRRAVDTLITEKGLDLLNTLDTHLCAFEQTLHTLSEAEAQQLSFLLDKLRNSN